MAWDWLGYRRWRIALRGADLRGSGPRPLMDQGYAVIVRLRWESRRPCWLPEAFAEARELDREPK